MFLKNLHRIELNSDDMTEPINPEEKMDIKISKNKNKVNEEGLMIATLKITGLSFGNIIGIIIVVVIIIVLFMIARRAKPGSRLRRILIVVMVMIIILAILYFLLK